MPMSRLPLTILLLTYGQLAVCSNLFDGDGVDSQVCLLGDEAQQKASVAESSRALAKDKEVEALDAREAVELASLILDSDLLELTRKPISQKLRLFALDKKQDLEDRRKVVFALGKLGDKESLDFLAEHIDTPIPVLLSPVDMEYRKTWVYFSALDSAGWDAIPAVLGQLKNERSDAALRFTKKILCNRLGESASRELLNRELRNHAVHNAHRINLIEVMKLIQEESK